MVSLRPSKNAVQVSTTIKASANKLRPGWKRTLENLPWMPFGLEVHIGPNGIMNPGGTFGLDLSPAKRNKIWSKDLEGRYGQRLFAGNRQWDSKRQGADF
jgi:hypothetical protein